MSVISQQHTATYCNTMQHTAHAEKAMLIATHVHKFEYIVSVYVYIYSFRDGPVYIV